MRFDELQELADVDLKIDGSGSGKVTIGIHEKVLFDIQKITLDFTRNINGEPDMNTHITTKIGYNLGFIKPSYDGAIFYISESIINTNINRYIYLSIDDFKFKCDLFIGGIDSKNLYFK